MFDLKRESAMLLVIDIQERLCASMDRRECEKFLHRAKILINGAHILKIPIVQSLQYKKGLGESVGEIFAGIPNMAFEKRVFSCCYENSELLAFLAQNPQIRQVIIIGMEAHICVLQTARDLVKRDFEVAIAQDCVLSRDSENKHNAIALMRDCGVCVANSESILFDLLKTSIADEFKAISALVK